MVVLMVLVLPDVAHGLKTYECWGGCYNVCLAKAGVSQSERLPCDHQCLDNCIPRNKSDYMYYCEIGCSMKRCIPVSYGTSISLSLSVCVCVSALYGGID